MDLRELIEAGSRKAGEQKALAALLKIGTTDIANAKAGRRGLPAPACFMLADYLGIDPATVIAASELVTEKNEERRKIFYPFVMGRAALFCAATVLLGTTALPPESRAATGNIKTSSPVNWHYVNYATRRLLRALRKWVMLPSFFYGR